MTADKTTSNVSTIRDMSMHEWTFDFTTLFLDDLAAVGWMVNYE